MIGAKRLITCWLPILTLLAVALIACELENEWTVTEKPDPSEEASEEGSALAESKPPAELAKAPAKPGDELGSGLFKPEPMAGIWRFTDNKGVIHYVDSIQKVPKRYRKRAIHPHGGSYSIVPATPIDELLKKHDVDPEKYAKKAPAKPAHHAKVICYTTSWCPYCKKATRYLRSQGIDFIEKDVGKSKADLKEMLAKSGGARGVPVLDVHGQILRGFNPRAIDAALKR